MTPVIDAAELRLLRIAYRRALGFPDMPDPDFLTDLAHELKNQLPSNVDQRDESELFYEYHSRGIRDYPAFDAKVTTTNDDLVCDGTEETTTMRSPLARNVCRQLNSLQRDLARDPARLVPRLAGNGTSPGTPATSADTAGSTSGLGSKDARP